jgi:hypothetical protein
MTVALCVRKHGLKLCMYMLSPQYLFRLVRKIVKNNNYLHHVCSSDQMSRNNSAPNGQIFMKLQYWNMFWKSAQKIKVSLKLGKNNGYFTWRPIYIFYHLTQFFLEWEMFQTKFVEKIKTHILCSITFFWKLCDVVK